MRRLFCISSGFLLAMFFFFSLPSVMAASGYTAEITESGASRSYTRSSDTVGTGGQAQPQPSRGDDTDGNAPSRMRPPGDDDEGGGERTRITLTPRRDFAAPTLSQVMAFSPVEQLIFNHLALQFPLQALQEDGLGHVNLNGQYALWLSDFLAGNDHPVESLNASPGMLYIPELFGETLAGFVSAAVPADTNTGTLIWITLLLGAEGNHQNIQLTIHYFTNIDDLTQMSLFMNHIAAIPAGTPVVASAIFQDDLGEDNPLDACQGRGLTVRYDSVKDRYEIVRQTDGAKRNQGQGGGHGAGLKIPSISEGDGNTDALALMVRQVVLSENETLSELFFPERGLIKEPLIEYEQVLDMESLRDTWQIKE